MLSGRSVGSGSWGSRWWRGTRLALSVVFTGAPLACAPLQPPTPPEPVGPDHELEYAPLLPAIPAQDGELAISVVHPVPGAVIGSVDSTFIFGSTGTGTASLWINERAVEVAPNGAFLAFLPVPENGVYHLIAATAADTVTLEREIAPRVSGPSLAPGSSVIVPGSVSPRGGWAAQPGEEIEVRFRGTPGGSATIVLPLGRRVPMVEGRPGDTPSPGESSRYYGYFGAETLFSADTTVPWPILMGAGTGPDSMIDDRSAYVELIVGGDTARTPLPLNLLLLDPERPAVGIGEPSLPPEGSGVVIGRPGPGFTYTYFWPGGTLLSLTGERDGQFRVALGPDLEAWVASDQVRLLPRGTPPPTGVVGTLRLQPGEDQVDLRIAITDRLPFHIEEGDRRLELTIFGGTSDTNWVLYGPTDPLIDRVEWSQPMTGRYRATIHLNEPNWGYQTHWNSAGDLVVRVRRPPQINPDDPLRGLLIAVDPGHPPVGATGPTGLTEAEANLAIARRLRPLLERAGAEVLMTRTDMTPVSLSERTELATNANADLLISIHNNALPDGVNPFTNNGTSVYFNHPHSLELARSLQGALLEEFGLRDLGIGRADLALVRPTWMPAVLTEGLFMMIPQQEAALRDPGVQERIARAHLQGIEEFLLRYQKVAQDQENR